jgi:hypothetical protein
MALEPHTAQLCARVRGRVDARSFDAYLSELRILELADGRVVIPVGATLEREVARRFGGTLVAAGGDLFSATQVVLAGESEALDLTAAVAQRGTSPRRWTRCCRLTRIHRVGRRVLSGRERRMTSCAGL